MKSILIHLAILLPLAAGAQQQGAAGSKKPFRNAPTHDDLAKRLQSMNHMDPMKDLKPASGEDPSKSAPKSDFLKESDIICFNGVATFVPKQAILAAPANLKDRLGIKEGARIVGWKEFLTLNRGWVSTIEVSRTQAEGVESLSEDTTDRISKSTNLIVATFRGGPISVLPPKADPDAESEPSTKPQP